MSNRGKELYDQGNKERLRGNHAECISLWKKATTWFENHGYLRPSSTVLSDIGYIYYQLGDYDSAEVYFYNSLTLAKSIKYKEHEGWNLNYLGLIYQRQGDLEKALRNFWQAFDVARETGDSIGESQSLSNIGSVYYRRGKLGKAIRHFRESLEVSRRIKDLEGQERCLNNIGSVYFSWHYFQKSLEYYNESLEILKCNSKENIAKIGRILNNVGQAFRCMSKLDQALNSFEESLRIAQKTGHRHILGIISQSMGEIYLDMGEPDYALEYLEAAYQIAKEENDKRGLVRILIDKGLGLKCKNQYEEALICFDTALGLAKSFADRDSAAICYNNKGRIFHLQEKHMKAIAHYERAFRILDELYSVVPSEEIRIEARKQLYNVLNNLVQSLIFISEYDKALAYIDHNKGREMFLMQVGANEPVPEERSAGSKIDSTRSAQKELQMEINSLRQNLGEIRMELKWNEDQYKLGTIKTSSDFEEEARLMKEQGEILDRLREKQEEAIKYPSQGLTLPKEIMKTINDIKGAITRGWLIIEFYYDRERGRLLTFCLEKEKETEMYEKELATEEMARLEDTAKKIIELRARSRDEAERFILWENLGKPLYEDLLPDELKNYLRANQFEYLTLIPTGVLHSLPLELLHDGEEYISLKYDLSRSFNLQTLFAAIRAQIHQEKSGLIIVEPLADKDINIEEMPPYIGIGLDKLNKTVKTTYEINKMLEDHSFTTKLLTSKDAEKNNILDHFNQYDFSILHFGGHAFFNAEYPDTSFLLIRDNSKPFELTANHISAHVDFVGNPFIFLCACETGGLDVRVGDELFGLCRGFITAGASGVLISGWKIFEESAGDFAKQFYQCLIEGNSIAKAIRQARNFVRKKAIDEDYIAEPYDLLHWGAFRFYGLPFAKIGQKYSGETDSKRNQREI